MIELFAGGQKAGMQTLDMALLELVRRGLVTNEPGAPDAAPLGKLEAFAGVGRFPARVKCATLAWHTLIAALADRADTVTTE